MKDRFIKMALIEAKKAYCDNEVPVGAIIVRNNEIISRTYNRKSQTKCAINHAEILAIKDASEKIGDWRLNECEMYVTLEPCPMCAGAIAQSRIKKVYIGTHSNIAANEKIISDIFQNSDYYHKVEYEYLDNQDCSQILTDFFENKR